MKKLVAIIIVLFLFSVTSIYAADPVEMKKRIGPGTGYHYSETIASGETGRNVKIPPLGLDGASISVTLHAGSGTGKFQFTTSSDTAVQGDTAIWVDWTEGNTTGSLAMALVTQVTGIRGVSVSGKITVEIVY